MRVMVIHHGKQWRRADNHMDCRHCPECGATVNGKFGQKAHERWHLEHAELLQSLSDRIGAPEDEPAGEAWTAAVDGGQAPELEASDGHLE